MPGSPTEGERWAAQELTRLRDARWSPRALLGFIAASQRRATLNRRGRPADARRAAGWIFIGAVAWLIATSHGGTGSGHRVRGLAWWAGCALMLDWHLGMLETADGDPVALGSADALTLTRAWMVPAVAADATPRLVTLGALSDLADGAVARRTRTTRLGRDLEGLVDACFTAASLQSALRARRISRLPVVLELGRLALGTGYLTVAHFTTTRAPDRTLSVVGRPTAPLRVASLIAAGQGRRRLADGLLLTGTTLALAEAGRRAVTGRRRP